MSILTRPETRQVKAPTHTATFVSDQGARCTIKIYATEKCWISTATRSMYRKENGKAIMSGWQANRRILLDTIRPIA
jgi:hypothetical protein